MARSLKTLKGKRWFFVENVRELGSMAFYHPDGLVPAWNLAEAFAGPKGRIATMPDLVDARIEKDLEQYEWNTYFTSNSSEFFGRDRTGTMRIVICHGVGPMSDLGGIKKVYNKYPAEIKDGDRRVSGGRVPIKIFEDLLDGKYGEVCNVPIDNLREVPSAKIYSVYPGAYILETQYPFIEPHSLDECLSNPIIVARCGGYERTRRMLGKHKAYAVKHVKRKHLVRGDQDKGGKCPADNPVIFNLDDPSQCSYVYSEPKKGYAYAHLLVMERLVNAGRGEYSYTPIEAGSGCHDWMDGVRFVGMKAEERAIHAGTDYISDQLLSKKRDLLWRQDKLEESRKLYPIVDVDGRWYTQYIKKGESMDTQTPMHLVTSLQEIGSPKEFKTTIGGYHGLFCYGLKEVEKIAPLDANGYSICSDIEILWANGNPKHHRCFVQFYKIEVDTSKRLIRGKEVLYDINLLLDLVT